MEKIYRIVIETSRGALDEYKEYDVYKMTGRNIEEIKERVSNWLNRMNENIPALTFKLFDIEEI